MKKKRTHWTFLVACSCCLWCAVLVNKTRALQIVPDTAELRLIALPTPSAADQVTALPTSQTNYITGDTFFVELWAQTTATEGLVQASADLSFNSAAVTAVSITHTPIFDIFLAGTIDNVAGTIDNLSGSHTPVDPPCSDQLGASPSWVRVAIVEMRARTAALTTINLLDSGDLFFVVAKCNSLVALSSTFVSVGIQVQSPQATVSLVTLPAASPSDLSATLPASQAGFVIGDSFVLEMWAQTDSGNGLAQVSTDIAFDQTLVSAGTITLSSLFNLFASGSINNFTGTIDNLSGAHPPVIPSCSDSVGTTPNWVRVATISMSANAVGPQTITAADANDFIFVMAVCGSEVAPVTTFGSVNVAVTLCGNGILEPGEDCDDGNLAPGDCCSPTCTFESSVTVCRAAVDGCDAVEFCDGAGACPVDSPEPAGTACGDPTNTICNAADTCDGAGACGANIAPVTTECRAITGACDTPEFCDGLGACPIDSFQLAGTTCGDPTASTCDSPDICDGAGTCSPEFAATTVLCRVAVDVCDVDDFCNGAGACDADVFQVAGTACGDPANTVCDNPDTCNDSGLCQANLEATTTACRGLVSDCDVVEFCDGLGRCPIDTFLVAGAACGDPSNTVCDNPDTCDGGGACLPNPELVPTLCRAAAGACDVDEFCDGLGSCPADTFQLAGTVCGDPVVTVCDAADSCDGLGACQPNFQPTSTVCRGAAPECDATEFCDGAGSCPPDAFALAGTGCGDPSGTVCDNPDSCDGSGTCITNLEPATTVCRLAAGECDVSETCDGLGTCLADAFQAAGLACGDPSSTVCDNPDSCDGSGSCQTNPAPLTTSCRAAVDQCDAEDFCDGAGSCPTDAFQPPGTACGDPTSSVCDGADTCNGTGACQANLEPITTVCRATGGVCDITEFCDGAGTCPLDAKDVSECRASAGECDLAEFCDGATNDCPLDGFMALGAPCGNPADSVCDGADTCDGVGACTTNIEPVTTSCRTSIGECDPQEFCDGVGSCPTNTLLPSGTACGDPTASVCDGADTCDAAGACLANLEPTTTVCRSTGGVCDVTEFCDGAGLCPADAKAVTECRAAASECDVPEICDGVANDCPLDGFTAMGTACGDPTNTICDAADTCDGGGTCAANLAPATTSCRSPAGECDAEEFCDGTGFCPADSFLAASTACGDPTVSVCDGADTCDAAGACLANLEPTTTVCRSTGGVCDVTEFCDGAGICPADAKAVTECRAAAGECDVPEICDGVANGCPPDGFTAMGTVCGDPTNTICDAADTCDGGGTCAANLAPATTSCRSPAGECDAEEFCDGVGFCPGDSFVAASAACGDPSSGVCDNPDSCDGLGACLANPEPTTTLCRGNIGDCDLDELCDGSGNCPADAFVLAGMACGDPTASLCDDPDTCDGTGTCLVNFLPDGTACTDGLFCDGEEACMTGVCAPGPPFCVDACEHCTEAAGACAWCIFDHNLNGTMDGLDFAFFSGCFGVCVPPTDACAVANYDESPDGCIGGGDFGAFSGCFGVTCDMCPGCSGPGAPGSFGTTASSYSNASIRLVPVGFSGFSDVSATLPFARNAFVTNERFSLEVWASQSGASGDGLGSVYVDVTFDPSVLELEQITTSDSFTLFSRGTADASGGSVSALGGCAPVGEGTLGANSAWVRVATLQMRTLGAGDTTVFLSPSYGPFGVSVYGQFGDLPSQQIDFGTAELRVQTLSPTLPRRGVQKHSSR